MGEEKEASVYVFLQKKKKKKKKKKLNILYCILLNSRIMLN